MGEEYPPSDPFEGVDVPRKGELSVSEINARIRIRISQHSRDPNFSWSDAELREELKKENDYENLKVRGPIQIAHGEKQILALNHDQNRALGVIFGTSATSSIPVYASMQATGTEEPQTVEALVKLVGAIKPQTENHFIISRGLADRLAVADLDLNEVRITELFQKPEDINLDNI